MIYRLASHKLQQRLFVKRVIYDFATSFPRWFTQHPSLSLSLSLASSLKLPLGKLLFDYYSIRASLRVSISPRGATISFSRLQKLAPREGTKIGLGRFYSAWTKRPFVLEFGVDSGKANVRMVLFLINI